MLLNIPGKITYITNIISTYRYWWQILISRISKKPLTRVTLHNGLTIEGRSQSVITDLIYEIFIEETYNPALFKIKPGNTVMDIGANVGVYSMYAAHAGAGQIYAIEPSEINTHYITENFSHNRLSAPVILQEAVSDHEGTAKLYAGPLDSHNLLFNHNHVEKFEKYTQVKTTTLEKIFDQYQIERVDFLKLDCEGSEGAIFATTPPAVWEKVKKIALEYHNPMSILNDRQLLHILRSLGFKTKQVRSDNWYGYIYAWK